MAIQIYCSNCYSSVALTAKKCTGCGAVFARDKKYRVSVSVKGRRASRVVDNLTIAREVEAAFKGDLVRNEFEISDHRVKDETLTLADLWSKYLPWAKEQKRTWKCDEYNYSAHLEPRFGKKQLDSIVALDVERMKLELKKSTNKQGRPFTQATIKHQLVLLKRLYNLAKRWGMYTGANPMDQVEIPKLDNRRTEFLTDEETERLVAVLDSWPCAETVAFVKFALFSGLRRGELFKLTWDDVDFERGMITLRSPKGGKTETIPISDEAKEVLQGINMTSMYVFPGRKGEQRTDFKGPWQKIRKAAGLPANFRFHGLRHNFASTLVSNGVDLCVIQGLLTHKDSRTTARYAHLSPGALKQAAQKSGELLKPEKKTRNLIRIGGQ
ncbi:MAG: tyrosine-type recombinase/integrase [Syntrophobacteraceae bacterium]